MIDQPPAVIQILDDAGDQLGERMAVTAWLKRIGVRVEVIGVCASACLWVLTLPKNQVCFAPGAWIGMHLFGPERIEWQRGAAFIARGWRRC